MKVVKIGEKEYMVGKMIGDEGVKMSFRLSKLLGGVMNLGASAKAVDEKAVDKKALSLSLNQLDVDELFNISKKLLAYVFTKDNRSVADNMYEEFNGDYSNLIPMLVEVIQENNFLSLFTGLTQLSKMITK
jgi:hypothetical protein